MFRLSPFHANIRKRLVRSSKLYFHDVGLASYLNGIDNPRQLVTSSLRGALFENLVVSEVLKHRFNQGRRSNLSFYRDSSGLECDLLYRRGEEMAAIEIKSGATIASGWFGPINRVAAALPQITAKAIVYGGEEPQRRTAGDVVPLRGLAKMLQNLDHTP